MITLENIFDYVDSDLKVENCFLFCQNKPICFKENKLYSHSNEFLNILKTPFYPSSKHLYLDFINSYNKNIDFTEINEDCIYFLFNFWRGTSHGFASIWSLLIQYLEEKPEKKILFLRQSNKSFHDLLLKIIPKDKIIFLERGKKYKIKNLNFYKNQIHTWSDNYQSKLDFLVSRLLVGTVSSEEETVIIVKNSKEKKHAGPNPFSYDYNKLLEFSKKNNGKLICPEDLSEIETVNAVNNCKTLVVSWGTSYIKNFRLISDKCEKIICFVNKNTNYEGEYNNWKKRVINKNNHVYDKFKNARVKYILTEDIDVNFKL